MVPVTIASRIESDIWPVAVDLQLNFLDVGNQLAHELEDLEELRRTEGTHGSIIGSDQPQEQAHILIAVVKADKLASHAESGQDHPVQRDAEGWLDIA